MTINSEISRVRYVGNGVTTNFAIDFPYLTNKDGSAQVAVYIGDSDIPLVEGKDYTVTGFGKYSDYSEQADEGLITYETRYEGGEIVFVTAPEDGVPVAVVRNVPETQGVVFVEGEEFPAQDFENALDKLTMQMQECKENLERAIVFPPTSNEKPLVARDAILKARDEAAVSAANALVSETNAKESETIAVQAKELIIDDAGVQAISADLLGENKIGYVAENLECVADNVATAVQAAASATEAANIASDAAINAKQTIDTETEAAKIKINDLSEVKIEEARIWAEGEQAEVKELGGELSSMGAADLAYAIANAPEDVPVDTSGLKILNVIKGEKGDKGDKGEDGKDGESFDAKGFLNLIYPIGSIYISTTSTCPIASYGVGTWELVSQDRVLQGAGTRGAVGTTLSESLPNIKGTVSNVSGSNQSRTVTGAFTSTNYSTGISMGGGGNYKANGDVGFDASRSSSIYKNNAPVQPNAYLVNIFRRVS